MNQLTFFTDDRPEPMTKQQRREQENRAAFAAFHQANPVVYRLLREKALAAAEAGETRISVKQLWHNMRASLQRTDGKPYRFNNTHVSYYARLLLANEPELDGLIEVRRKT